jgi:hypothetical protein
MKNLCRIAVIVLCLSGTARAGGLVLELKAHYFSPTEQAFEDIYGGGPMVGGEASIGVWKGLELWFGGDYFSKKGELTFTKEETELEIFPIGGGLKYRLEKGIMSFYAAAGLLHFSFKESNPIGEVSSGGMGYIGRVGGYLRLTGGLLIDLYMNYSSCTLQPADFEIDIGGFGAGGGIAIEF